MVRRALFLTVLAFAGIAPAAHAADGAVTLVRSGYGTPPVTEQAFLAGKIFRMTGTSFWHPGAWARRSAYALDPASPVVAAHPDWILKDALGNPLYLGSQYAADFGNTAYRAWWIGEAAAQAYGYRGLYVDDVTLTRRVTTAAGTPVTPRDPRTFGSMTEANWQRYMADFAVSIRASLPNLEIVHDVLWYKLDAYGSNVRRALDAAGYVAIEGGVNDPSITGGAGTYGWQTLAGFVERRQAAGYSVILDGSDASAAGRLYGLANALLLDGGRLLLGNDAATAPATFWKGYDVKLGAPIGTRYASGGVWRRDFTGGVVLVNEPQQPARTIALGARFWDLDGVPRDSVTLAAGSGAVLIRRVAPTPPPVVEPPAPVPTPTATPAPKPPAPRPPRKSDGKAHSAGAAGPSKTTTTAKVSRSRVFGRVRGARGGTVNVTVQRRKRGSWATVRRTEATVTKSGTFARQIPKLGSGTYRVAASFEGTGTAKPSRSDYARTSF